MPGSWGCCNAEGSHGSRSAQQLCYCGREARGCPAALTGGIRGRTRGMGRLAGCTLPSTLWKRTPPRLRDETRLGRSMAPGPLAFRDGETEAQRCLSHCPVQAHRSHVGQRQPENTGVTPLSFLAPPAASLQAGAPTGGLCSPCASPHGSWAGEGAGWRPSFQEAHLFGA